MRKSDLKPRTWCKSTYNNANQSCVEVAEDCPGIIPVHDSKNADEPALVLSADAWAAFISEVKSDEFHAR
ncbi:DUF397 domain-containing protein [Streptomyces sp. NPDC057654]|uniref:DUF397 domain-containing protein n=1 Tax=Streptomyces sp. NPDC057654 TaxID=3346196 RepID=UPI003679C1F5